MIHLPRVLLLLATSLAFTLPLPAAAVVSQAGGVAFQNTTAAGLDASSSEDLLPELIGRFGGFLVTAVGPKHVLAASHIGGSIGDSVVFDTGPNTGSYLTVGVANDPASDLRLWEVDGVLSSWVDLYRDPDEVTRVATIFGRGAPVGPQNAIILDILPILQPLKGWTWGSGGAVSNWSWGRNAVKGTVSDPTNGPVMSLEFNRAGLPNECHLSSGDSSGPWFLLGDDGFWKLAGTSTAVEGPFELTPGGASVNAMLLDKGGLFQSGFPWPELVVDFPTIATAVRVSQRLAWLDAELPSEDADADGVLDHVDNCTSVANPGQQDTDGDGSGNTCDCDFDQNNLCNIDDFSAFLPAFLSTVDPGIGADMDSSGIVNIDDFSLFLPGFIFGGPLP